jgi:hypothetical protein
MLKRIELRIANDLAAGIDHLVLEHEVIRELRAVVGFEVDLQVSVGGTINYLDTTPLNFRTERSWHQIMLTIEAQIWDVVHTAIEKYRDKSRDQFVLMSLS